MQHVIKPKRSDVAGAVPTTLQLESGEIAINLADKKLFVRDTSNNILELTTRTYNSFDDVYLSGTSNGQALQYNAATSRWENSTLDTGPWNETGNNLYYNPGSGARVAIGATTHTGTYDLEVSGILNASEMLLGGVTSIGTAIFNMSKDLVTSDYLVPSTYNAEAPNDTAIAEDVTVSISAGSILKVTDLTNSD